MVTTVLLTLTICPKGQYAWITLCAFELAALVSDLRYPIAYFASMQKETLRAFGHSINSETKLSAIHQHIAHVDRQLRELCTGWATTAGGQSGQIRWKTTDNI